MEKEAKIYVAGHRGMVGSAIVRKLLRLGYTNLLLKTSAELDLRDQVKVAEFFASEKPDYVFLAAAKVGGIVANNTYRADFLYENLAIQNNIIHASFINKVKKLQFLGSSCIYPKLAPQPLKESYLLSGYLEETNEPYAIAKIAGIKMCESYNFQHKTNYKCLMPSNLYGPNDNYNLKTSHFLAALLVKGILAKKNKKKEIILWGNGKAKRELTYVDDVADACIYFINKKTKETLINIGSGCEMSILEYAKFILKKINYKCKIVLDNSKLDGTPRKIVDSSIARSYGWSPKIDFNQGFDLTLKDYENKYLLF